MAGAEDQAAAVIEPVEQRTVVLPQAGDDEVLAARVDSSDIYLPVRPICVALGVAWPAQYRKIKSDDVLMESIRTLRLQTRGGPHNLICMDLEAIPLWLASIEPRRVREDRRERLRAYKRWVRKVVYEAFARETGLVPHTPPAPPSASAAPDTSMLLHIEQMGLAIAQMAREQRAFEEHVTIEVSTLRSEVTEQHTEVMGRLDQAAAVVGNLLRRMNAVEGMVTSGDTITEAQAAEISALVRSIAGELAQRGAGRNPYQGVFSALYREFRVATYRNIPAARFGDVMAWLKDYQETIDTHGDA